MRAVEHGDTSYYETRWRIEIHESNVVARATISICSWTCMLLSADHSWGSSAAFAACQSEECFKSRHFTGKLTKHLITVAKLMTLFYYSERNRNIRTSLFKLSRDLATGINVNMIRIANCGCFVVCIVNVASCMNSPSIDWNFQQWLLAFYTFRFLPKPVSLTSNAKHVNYSVPVTLVSASKWILPVKYIQFVHRLFRLWTVS